MSGPPQQQQSFYPPTYASSTALGAAGWAPAAPDSVADDYSDSPVLEGSIPPEAGSSHAAYSLYGDGADAAGMSEAGGAGGGGAAGEKKKSTRGARACTHCRGQKMKCVGGENGPPCSRCKKSGKEVSRPLHLVHVLRNPPSIRLRSSHNSALLTASLALQCIFEESQRGKRSNRKTDAMVSLTLLHSYGCGRG